MLILPPGDAQAADFTARFVDDYQGSIQVRGEILFDDHKKLLAALRGREVQKGMPIYLDLNSSGGNFAEALKIAKLALEKRLSTRLGRNAECLSACAIIFMAGTRFTTVG